MSLDVLDHLRRFGRAYPTKAPPIPVVMTGLGAIGHVEHRRELYINSAIKHQVELLVREHDRAERLAQELSGGKLTAHDILSVAQLGTDSRDAIRAIKSMRGAITSWDSVVSAISSGKVNNYMGTKASLTTVANNWSSFILAGGNPAAFTYVAIPGATYPLASAAGAWPIPITLGGSEDLYLTNLGTNHATGTNVVLAVDLLTANGSISATIVTSQNVNSTALPRWTGGAGVLMTLEVTTAFGTATGIPNVRVNYTDQSGNATSDTGNITIGATSLIANRLFPLQDGPQIRMASGDYGVRSIEQVTFSASSAGAGAAAALLQYKPLLFVPTLATTTFSERSTPAQIGGIRKLTSVAGGSLPFIGFFVLTSTTSTGVQTYLLEMVYG